MQFIYDPKLEIFILFLSGASESWFLYLVDNNKDSWAHLSAAFLRRLGKAGVNNVIYSDVFYTRTQKETEKFSDFIASMMSLYRCKITNPSRPSNKNYCSRSVATYTCALFGT